MQLTGCPLVTSNNPDTLRNENTRTEVKDKDSVDRVLSYKRRTHMPCGEVSALAQHQDERRADAISSLTCLPARPAMLRFALLASGHVRPLVAVLTWGLLSRHCDGSHGPEAAGSRAILPTC